jgi:hypothetical protein
MKILEGKLCSWGAFIRAEPNTAHIVKNIVKMKTALQRKCEKCLSLLVGAQGLEPWTR